MAPRSIRNVLIPAVFFIVFLGCSSDHALAFVPSQRAFASIAGPIPMPAIGDKTGDDIFPRSSAVSLRAGIVPTTTEAIQEMTNARFAFGLCFYGAAGIGSIGRELIPVVFGRYQTTSSIETDATTTLARNSNSNKKNKNNNRGAAADVADEDLGIWGYPEKIYRKDVEMILNNPVLPLAIAKKYPISQDADAADRYQYTHMKDSVPFLGYDGFAKANPRANPVALRAVFDSFSNSIGGSNAVSPITAQRNIDSFMEDSGGRQKRGTSTVTGALAKKLNGGKAIGITAFFFLLVLLGVGDWLAIFHLWKGWFPEWQGFSDVPSSLFDKDIGFAVLPDFFVGDVPSAD